MALLATPVFATGMVLDTSQIKENQVSLTEYFAVLEDSSTTLTLADVQKPEVASRFKADQGPAAAVNFGYTRSAYWLRLTLRNTSSSPVDRLLEIRNHISSIQLHQPMADGGYQSVTTGTAAPFSTRPYKNRYFVFPVKLPPGSTLTYFVQLKTSSNIAVSASLWLPQAFHDYERNDYNNQMLYFGMAAGLALFNLLLFLILRDTPYLLYVSFVVCAMLGAAARTGLGSEFLWPLATQWSDIAVFFCETFTIAVFLLFMRLMLDTRHVAPRLDWLIKAAVSIQLITTIGFVVSFQSFAKPAVMLNLSTAILVTGVGLYCVFKRQRSAYLFMLAFSMLLVGSFLTILKSFGLVPTNNLTVYGLQFGSASEMILLAIALADRFNEIRRERAKAQGELFAAQKLLVESLQSSERILEQRVASRTLELAEKNDALNRSIRSREDVERIARHDLKTPLGSIVAAPALLRGHLTPVENERVLNMIESAARRALDMVNLSLDLYKVESGSYVFRPKDVDLTQLVRAVVLDLTAHAGSKSIEMIIPEDIPHVMVEANESFCYSIVANLTKNAIEAAPEGSVVRLFIEGEPRAILRIQNEGAVPDSLRATFFDKYSTDGKEEGTGLGTYSAHMLARAQGGRLTMESSDERTTLNFELKRSSAAPAAQQNGLPNTDTPPEAASAHQNSQAQRVLVVDDDQLSLMLMNGLLRHENIALETAVNGHQALASIKNQRSDVIILDINMPVMGGMETLKRIREYQAATGQTPSMIIAFSADDDPESQAAYLNLGFDRCLNKPCAKEDLLRLLDSTRSAAGALKPQQLRPAFA